MCESEWNEHLCMYMDAFNPTVFGIDFYLYVWWRSYCRLFCQSPRTISRIYFISAVHAEDKPSNPLICRVPELFGGVSLCVCVLDCRGISLMEQPNALSSRHNASKWQTYIVLVDWCLEYLCDSNACLLLRSIGCVPLTSWYFSRLCVLMLYTTANQSCFSPLWAVFPPGNRQRAQCLGKLVYCISQSVDRTMEECAVRNLFFSSVTKVREQWFMSRIPWCKCFHLLHVCNRH